MAGEILSPVGGEEQLVAAVRSGADAVYFGTKALNARRNASNFGDGELEGSIRYCHERGVRVYITLNTLVCDDELELLRGEIVKVAEAGADAVILQDLACAAFAKNICPGLPLHASTQMAVHNAEGLRALRKLGFSRAVVARELSLSEIKLLHQEVPELELEVFVHGALCMSVSGACYMSSMIGGRSGNRGLCAQPCRLDFRTDSRDYALSLKDLCIIPHLKELEKIGVSSFKIEGRMKRPEYVAAATDACVKALHGEEPDLGVLRDVFSRGGFTEGYYTGKRNALMFGHRTREDAEASQAVIKSLRGLYSRERNSIPVDMLCLLQEDKSVLTVTCNDRSVTVSGEKPTPGTEHCISSEDVKKQLAKTGNTPFFPASIDARVGDGLRLSFSVINSMRRQALEEMARLMGEKPPREVSASWRADAPQALSRHREPSLRARFSSVSGAGDTSLFDRIILPADEILSDTRQLSRFGDKLIAELPHMIFPEYESRYRQKVREIGALGIRDIYCDNIGFSSFCLDEGFTVHGGYGLNITNSVSLAEYERMGISDAVLSFELSFERIASIAGSIPVGIIGYGYLPLMNYRSCPLRNEKGCGSCPGYGKVTDPKLNVFRVQCLERMYSVLYNCLPLYVGDIRLPETDFVLLWFTSEDARRADDIARAFTAGEKAGFERTRGLYRRELI
ncbi:MAG: U32 family peptidase [Eubacteriaceae bacterium]|nr:U32 family peptidase [Eubacteriaceae bacterium]